MKELLYILIHSDNTSFKVGITNNMKSRLNSIERDFGNINKSESLVYSCDNRSLLENIEHGIHAYLNNHYFSPKFLGGGSTEWFSIHAFKKAIKMIQLFIEELENFNFEDNLKEFLERKIDFEASFAKLDQTKNFLEIHSKVVNEVNNFIYINIEEISVSKRKGAFVVTSDNLNDLMIDELPIFQWVRKEGRELIFDIQIYNKWKKDKSYKATRGLVEIKFFNDFNWKNYKAMFTNKYPYQHL